jgi:hypothetical protein
MTREFILQGDRIMIAYTSDKKHEKYDKALKKTCVFLCDKCGSKFNGVADTKNHFSKNNGQYTCLLTTI